MMHIQDMIMLVIENEPDKQLRGRGFLQKKMFFLSLLCVTAWDYKRHLYGEHSSEVSENLDLLVYARFIKEFHETLSDNRSVLGEVESYTYNLTSDGETVMQVIRVDTAGSDWIDKLALLNEQDGADDLDVLSVAAKLRPLISSFAGGRASRTGSPYFGGMGCPGRSCRSGCQVFRLDRFTNKGGLMFFEIIMCGFLLVFGVAMGVALHLVLSARRTRQEYYEDYLKRKRSKGD